MAGLRAMKGHQVVVDAAVRILASGRRARFVFVGRGTREEAVRAAVREAGLEAHVKVAGWATNLPAVMASLDIALYVPLESEGMSRVLFEYLAAGRPLVAARTGVVPEVLRDGTDALLVPAGDAAALASALTRLLDEPSLRARLAEAGRRRLLEHYSGARVAEALEAQYTRLVA